MQRVGPLDSRSPHISRMGARVPIPSGISTILSRLSSRGRQTLMPYTNTRNQQIRSIISVTSPQNLIFSNTASLRFPPHRVVSTVQLEPVYRWSPYRRITVFAYLLDSRLTATARDSSRSFIVGSKLPPLITSTAGKWLT